MIVSGWSQHPEPGIGSTLCNVIARFQSNPTNSAFFAFIVKQNKSASSSSSLSPPLQLYNLIILLTLSPTVYCKRDKPKPVENNDQMADDQCEFTK